MQFSKGVEPEGGDQDDLVLNGCGDGAIVFQNGILI